MKTLSREGIQRMTNSTGIGGISRSGGGGGGSTSSFIENARHADSAYDVDSNSPAYLRWLRKNAPDTAAEVITFAKGLISTLKSYFRGGIEVTNGTKTDVLNVTGGASVGSSLGVTGNATIGGNTSVGGNETVTGSVTAAMFIANILKTPDFAQAAGMMGLGFGVTTDANGRATLQTDDLLVLGRMIVNSLNIREVTYIGGTYLLTPAGSTVAKVMPLYQGAGYNTMNSYRWTTEYNSSYPSVVGYRLMWKADDGTTGTMNYWHVGDQAYCHTFNITEPGDYTNVSNRHYWRLVCRVGQVETEGSDGNITTWHYADLSNLTSVYLYDSEGNQLSSLAGSWTFIGRQTNPSQTVPDAGDKVVCLGSQYDDTRQGAVQITAEGVASIGIYDGINDFIQPSINNFEIHYFSKNAVRMNSAYVTWKYREDGQDKTKTQTSIIADQASISLRVTNALEDLGYTGIDIENKRITLSGDMVTFTNNAGEDDGKIWIDPSTGTLHAVDGSFSGTVSGISGSFGNLYCENDDDVLFIGSNSYFNGVWGTVNNTLAFQYGGKRKTESGGAEYGVGHIVMCKIGISDGQLYMSTELNSESIVLKKGIGTPIVTIDKNSDDGGRIFLCDSTGYPRITLDGTNGDINMPNGTIKAASIKTPTVESRITDVPVALPDNLITGSGNKFLPSNPVKGMTVLVKGTSGDITVYGDIMASDSASTVTSLAIGRGSHIFTYDGTQWIHFDCS